MAASESAISISVVVPARNEEATIAAVVERSFQAFNELGRTGEVLVVNDGSTDATAAVLTELQARYPHLRVFTQRRSRGMTAALQRMFTASQGEIVILVAPGRETAASAPNKALSLLVSTEKIVLMATHDPILALMAERRLVIRNGGILKVIATTPKEKENLEKLEALDNRLLALRHRLRSGELIEDAGG
jgi:glycosyltransferase involved in cell wall biosynthesis